MSPLTSLVARGKQAVFGISDWVLIERYVLGELTSADCDAFEHRLENDEPFFERAMPLINFFRFGLASTEDPLVAAAKARAAEEAFWHRTREALELLPAPYQPALFHKPTRSSWWRRVAAAMDARLLQLSIATASVLVAVTVGFFGIPRLESTVGAWSDARQGRADWRWIPQARELETGPFESLRVAMADSSVAELGPSARMHYHGLGAAAGLSQAEIAIDGDVTLRLPATKVYATLRTHEVEGMLMPGTYHIHAVPKSGSTTIDVVSGEALVRGLQEAPGAQVKIGAGQQVVFGVAGRR